MSKARDLARVMVDTSGLIAAGNLGNAVPADGSITSAKIADGTIATADLADSAVTNAKIAALAASKLTGQVPRANAPSGSILQALQATNNSVYAISGTGTFTNLSISITPTSSSSRFLLLANIGQIGHSGNGSTIALNFARNGSSLNYISGGSYNGMVTFVNADTNAGNTTGPTIIFIDSPNTTSAITYSVIYALDGNKWVGRRGQDGYIAASQQFQVLEIA